LSIPWRSSETSKSAAAEKSVRSGPRHHRLLSAPRDRRTASTSSRTAKRAAVDALRVWLRRPVAAALVVVVGALAAMGAQASPRSAGDQQALVAEPPFGADRIIAGTASWERNGSPAAEAAAGTFPGRNGTILAGGGEKLKLFAVTVDGRRPTEIRGVRTASGGGQAAWSPDGARIAFARQAGGISIVDAGGGGELRVTTRGEEPAWSPDGAELAFSRAGWIYVIGANGRGLRRLIQGEDPQWSPDGKRIALQFRERDASGDDIYITSPTATEWVRLTVATSAPCDPLGALHGSFHHVDPSWSPDGKHIAYVSWFACGANEYSDIEALGVDGAPGMTLASGGGQEGGPFTPVWSPDGKALAYSEDYDYPGAPNGLKVKPLGGKARKIASNWLPFDWRPVCGLRGGKRGDRLRGSAGADLVCGLAGNDTISGGAGSDRLFGEQGNDRFLARDGEFDIIGCGQGRDSVVADTSDRVGRDCEQVERQ
jgi:hypothetical protein